MKREQTTIRLTIRMPEALEAMLRAYREIICRHNENGIEEFQFYYL